METVEMRFKLQMTSKIMVTAKKHGDKRDYSNMDKTKLPLPGFGETPYFFQEIIPGESYEVLSIGVISVSNILVYVYTLFDSSYGDNFYYCPNDKDDIKLRETMLFKGANRLYDFFYTPEELRDTKIDTIIE